MNVYLRLDLAFEAPILFRHLGNIFSDDHLKSSHLFIKVVSLSKSGKLGQRPVRLKQKLEASRDREESLARIAITLSYLQCEHYLLLDITLEVPVLFSC